MPVSGGAVMPIWSILNHCFDFPSQAEKDPPQLYIHTMTGPCWCVHCDQKAVLPEGEQCQRRHRSSSAGGFLCRRNVHVLSRSDGRAELRGGASVAGHHGVRDGEDGVVAGPLPLDGGG